MGACAMCLPWLPRLLWKYHWRERICCISVADAMSFLYRWKSRGGARGAEEQKGEAGPEEDAGGGQEAEAEDEADAEAEAEQQVNAAGPQDATSADNGWTNSFSGPTDSSLGNLLTEASEARRTGREKLFDVFADVLLNGKQLSTLLDALDALIRAQMVEGMIRLRTLLPSKADIERRFDALKADINALKADIKADINALKADINALKSRFKTTVGLAAVALLLFFILSECRVSDQILSRYGYVVTILGLCVSWLSM
jgi:hypothetical protein